MRGGRPGLLCACRQGALSGVFDVSFLFNFRRILTGFYLLISTAFLMHLSAYITVLKTFTYHPTLQWHHAVHLTHPNFQASPT